MNKTIGILAHVDSGKTTFSEQILYHTNAIRNRGRVDHKDTFLDNHEIERKRGITIFSEQGHFKYNNNNYYLIDTPGHIDFSPEMERSLKIMDYAILIISAVEGVQAHTETVFRLLKKNNVPAFFFINKIDRIGADVSKTISDIKKNLTKDAILIENFDDDKELEESVIESIAERDDNLFERYLDGYYDKEEFVSSLKRLIKECFIYPCFFGSALLDKGIKEFIESLDKLTYTQYNTDGKFIGKVYKIKHDENNRITYIKALGGSLKTKDEVSYIYNDKSTYNNNYDIDDKCKNNIKTDKINSIRTYNANKFTTESEAFGGQLFAATGVEYAMPGDYIFIGSDLDESYTKEEYDLVPTLKSKVIYDSKLNNKEVLSYFKILESEEPALKVSWSEKLSEINIHVMGKIQLEILKDVVKDRFNVDVEFGPCEIIYKETIESKTIGYGHFEPLGHYSEVHIQIEPGERNSGMKFESKAHVDDLSIGHQNLVKTHVFEKAHRGILGGYDLTDLKITLVNGRAHNKHTSGGDFREATYRALRQGLENTKNIILEPYYKFKIEVDVDYIGRVLSDIQKLHGEFEDPMILDGRAVVCGRGPVKTFMDYSMGILTFTKGRGNINCIFDGYDVCHNQEEVIENSDYDKNVDPEYTSISIFCSKGKGYSVEGKDVKDYMHCL